MDIKEGQDFQPVQLTDFPATQFFQHLSKGTTFFQNKEFEKAITEWQEAAKRRPNSEELPMISESRAKNRTPLP